MFRVMLIDEVFSLKSLFTAIEVSTIKTDGFFVHTEVDHDWLAPDHVSMNFISTPRIVEREFVGESESQDVILDQSRFFGCFGKVHALINGTRNINI
jgi:hypothetical protein